MRQAPTRTPGRNDPCWCGSGKKYKRCHADTDAGTNRREPGALLQAESVTDRVRPGQVSPLRQVPAHIPRPGYVDNGGTPPTRGQGEPKTPEQLARMRQAGRLAREILVGLAEHIRPGVTTDELDEIAHDRIVAAGAYPSPLGYQGYPKSICTSVNEVVCHGIPDDRPLAEGDILNIDVTVYLDGVHGDTSVMFCVGDVDPERRRLVETTRRALDAGIAAVRAGAEVRDIGRAIQDVADSEGLGVVRAFVGHGVGEDFHSEPTVYHYYEPSARRRLEPGMTFTIEPMLTLGTWRHKLWDDGWTAVTADLAPSAQFEHTVAVTDTGAEILTALSDDPQPFLG